MLPSSSKKKYILFNFEDSAIFLFKFNNLIIFEKKLKLKFIFLFNCLKVYLYFSALLAPKAASAPEFPLKEKNKKFDYYNETKAEV